jgi:hypothetical protein
MTDYCRWSLRQFYLLVFWPSRFRRDVEAPLEPRRALGCEARLKYLLQLLPWTAAVAALGNYLAGRPILDWGLPYGLSYSAVQAWVGTGVGVAFGLALGGALGVAVGLPAVALGGAVFGLAFGVATKVTLGVLAALAAGTLAGVVLGMAASDTEGGSRGLLFGSVVGLIIGLANNVQTGAALGVFGAVSCGLAARELESLARGPAFGTAVSVVTGLAGGALAALAFAVAAGVPVAGLSGLSSLPALLLSPGLTARLLIGVLSSVLVGVLVGLSEGPGKGIAAGLAFSLLSGLVLGLELGTSAGRVVGGAVGLAVGVVFALGLGVPHRPMLGSALGHLSSLACGAAWMAALGSARSGGFDGVAGIAAGMACLVAFWLTYFRLAAYPFEAVLSAAVYYSARSHPERLARAWRWCPVAWNEVVWLMLPCVGRLLALLVRHDRERGFGAIVFVASERSLQRQAARDALVEVALADLEGQSVRELANVAERLRWTTDAPLELPVELAAALTRFDRAAQLLGQYLALQSPYRRREALKRAREEIEALQRGLIAGGGRERTRLLRVALAWGRLLEEERELFLAREEALHQAAEQRDIPNPFVFGNPVTEQEASVFTGRKDIVLQLEESVLGTRQAPALLLHGPRRMGKTSILYQLPRLLGPEFVPALVDCQNPAVTSSTSSAATVLRYLSRALSAGLQRRRVTVEPLRREALEREPYAVFDEWLDDVESAMPGKTRALLCLDEYESLQRIVDIQWGEELLDALRHTLQHRPRVVLLFTGAHTFEEQGRAWTDRFVSARRVRVSFLTREEVIPLLTEPIPEFNLTYVPEALEALIEATHGQPFLTQAVAFELVQYLNEHRCREATPADVEAAVGRALVSSSEYFANVWFDAGEEGQAILLALARGRKPPYFPEACSWLREHDVLDDNERFAVPMMERWVKKEKIV